VGPGPLIPPGVAGFEAENAVAGVPAVSGVAGPVADAVAVMVAEPDVLFAVGLDVSQHGPAFGALASVPDVAEPQASVDIAPPFHVSAPVSVVAVEVDSPGRPRFAAFPNVDYRASPSSCSEVVGEESVRSSTGVRANHGLCRILSNPGLRHNRNAEHCYNRPRPGRNNVSDTTGLPMDATTSRSRRTCLHRFRERRTHPPHQASRSLPEVPQMEWVEVAAEELQC